MRISETIKIVEDVRQKRVDFFARLDKEIQFHKEEIKKLQEYEKSLMYHSNNLMEESLFGNESKESKDFRNEVISVYMETLYQLENVTSRCAYGPNDYKLLNYVDYLKRLRL